MNIVKRAKAPTSKFFKTLRTVGLSIATIGGTIISAPITLPLGVISIGGYLIVAGGILSAVSQITTVNE
ncbi:hypothetical protein [Flavobacterium pectinovorum]|uniref:hypothetical protein n=1 Tax=Flavobacterium pectinovorum TaxID=29533 RepID=UPI001FAC3E80|nr:hypothetical protein [Flavobacterium pectinovorum]MCI9844543.1 hypothetical protein [Flavobacterium pectinovorum]